MPKGYKRKPVLNKEQLMQRVKRNNKFTVRCPYCLYHIPWPMIQVKYFTNAFLRELNTAFVNHETVEIKNFGVFKVAKYRCKGYNMIERKPIFYKGRIWKVKFKMGRWVRQKLLSQSEE